MIDIELVETSINELENGSMSYEVCRNLAALYSVRDNYYKKLRTDEGQFDSEFLRTVAGLPVQEVLNTMDELMNAVKIMNTRTYIAVIEQLKKIGAD